MNLSEFTAELKIKSEKVQGLLKQSLFYYCSGKDVSPIVAFKQEYPLYVYADIVNYGRGNFDIFLNEFFERLKSLDFLFIQKVNLVQNFFDKEFENIVLSEWQTVSGNTFLLLFVQGDACKVFKAVYSSETLKSVLPKCICNYRYEMRNRSFLERIEQNVEYILGHCFNKNFEKINQFSYYGDYGSKQAEKIFLFKREDN